MSRTPRKSLEHREAPRRSTSSALEQAIESERAVLLQARAVIESLNEVLLYAEGEKALMYAEAAHIATVLIEEAVERLDPARLRPMIEALQEAGREAAAETPAAEAAQEPTGYLC